MELNKNEPIHDIGNKLSDFKILSELGRGSYGVVFKVYSYVDGNIYVIKKMDFKHMKEKQQKEAWKEAMILKKIDHRNIIKYYNSFLEDDCLYIVMEYAEGGDLFSLAKSYKKNKKLFSETDLWRYLHEILLGLNYLHLNNIIHRDIKCLNLFLGKNKSIKIGDLGVSKIVSNINALHCTRVGTPLYLSPELIKQVPYDFKVDIWSVGCSMYHLACLEPPFQGENLIVLGNNIVKMPHKPIPSNYSRDLSKILDICLSKKPDQRPSAKDAIDMIPMNIKEEYRIKLLNKNNLKDDNEAVFENTNYNKTDDNNKLKKTSRGSSKSIFDIKQINENNQINKDSNNNLKIILSKPEEFQQNKNAENKGHVSPVSPKSFNLKNANNNQNSNNINMNNPVSKTYGNNFFRKDSNSIFHSRNNNNNINKILNFENINNNNNIDNEKKTNNIENLEDSFYNIKRNSPLKAYTKNRINNNNNNHSNSNSNLRSSNNNFNNKENKLNSQFTLHKENKQNPVKFSENENKKDDNLNHIDEYNSKSSNVNKKFEKKELNLPYKSVKNLTPTESSKKTKEDVFNFNNLKESKSKYENLQINGVNNSLTKIKTKKNESDNKAINKIYKNQDDKNPSKNSPLKNKDKEGLTNNKIPISQKLSFSEDNNAKQNVNTADNNTNNKSAENSSSFKIKNPETCKDTDNLNTKNNMNSNINPTTKTNKKVTQDSEKVKAESNFNDNHTSDIDNHYKNVKLHKVGYIEDLSQIENEQEMKNNINFEKNIITNDETNDNLNGHPHNNIAKKRIFSSKMRKEKPLSIRPNTANYLNLENKNLRNRALDLGAFLSNENLANRILFDAAHENINNLNNEKNNINNNLYLNKVINNNNNYINNAQVNNMLINHDSNHVISGNSKSKNKSKDNNINGKPNNKQVHRTQQRNRPFTASNLRNCKTDDVNGNIINININVFNIQNNNNINNNNFFQNGNRYLNPFAKTNLLYVHENLKKSKIKEANNLPYFKNNNFDSVKKAIPEYGSNTNSNNNLTDKNLNTNDVNIFPMNAADLKLRNICHNNNFDKIKSNFLSNNTNSLNLININNGLTIKKTAEIIFDNLAKTIGKGDLSNKVLTINDLK